MKKLICGLTLIFCLVSLFGCSPKPDPKEPVNQFFEAAKTLDYDKMKELVAPENSDEIQPKFTGEMANYESCFADYLKESAAKLEFTIEEEVEEKDDNATVKVHCKYIDGSQILKETMSEYLVEALDCALKGEKLSEEKTAEMIASMITEKQEAKEETMLEKTIEISCVKIENKWYLSDVNDELKNLIYSNCLTASDEISESLQQVPEESSGSTSSATLL